MEKVFFEYGFVHKKFYIFTKKFKKPLFILDNI